MAQLSRNIVCHCFVDVLAREPMISEKPISSRQIYEPISIADFFPTPNLRQEARHTYWTMDDHDELAQTLLDDDQPSWVTLSQEEYDVGNNDISGLNGGGGGGEARSSASAWDRNSNNNVGKQNRRRKDNNELPKFIPLLRLGNMGAAFLLIYGSVSDVYDRSFPALVFLLFISIAESSAFPWINWNYTTNQSFPGIRFN